MKKKACILPIEQLLAKQYEHEIMTCNFFQLINNGQHQIYSFFTLEEQLSSSKLRAQLFLCSS